MEVGKCGVMGQTAGKPHHFSTLLHHLFKVQGLSVSHQPCLQTVVEHNPWFLDEHNFNFNGQYGFMMWPEIMPILMLELAPSKTKLLLKC